MDHTVDFALGFGTFTNAGCFMYAAELEWLRINTLLVWRTIQKPQDNEIEWCTTRP